jgi:hypothetical protein
MFQSKLLTTFVIPVLALISGIAIGTRLAVPPTQTISIVKPLDDGRKSASAAPCIHELPAEKSLSAANDFLPPHRAQESSLRLKVEECAELLSASKPRPHVSAFAYDEVEAKLNDALENEMSLRSIGTFDSARCEESTCEFRFTLNGEPEEQNAEDLQRKFFEFYMAHQRFGPMEWSLAQDDARVNIFKFRR